MSTPTSGRIPQQRLGRRPGIEPYYTIAEQTATRLVLQSRPDANRRAGYAIIIRGGALFGLALLIIVSGFMGGALMPGGSFATLAFVVVIGGILGGLGFRRIIGGVAVASTTNRITVDADAGAITYAQVNRVARERTQALPIAAVEQLRLRSSVLIRGGMVSRRDPIVVLELVTSSGTAWFVDSAADRSALEPAATGLAAVLGREISSANNRGADPA